MPAVVDLDKCDGCGDCLEECPTECITLEGEGDNIHAVVNAEECIDCEVCVDVCEQGALSMVEEPIIEEPIIEEPIIENKQVFISHDEEDAQFAHRLADDLQRLGVQVWIAPESIRGVWVDAINRGLEESSHMLVVLTPAAVGSRWVTMETNVAIDLERKGRMEVIPLDVKPCEVPLLWRIYQMISFRRDYGAGFQELSKVLGLRSRR